MFSKSHNHQSVADNKEHESDSNFFDLSPLPLPTGAVGVSAWNSCRSLNDVYLDYGPGFEPLEKSIRAIFGLVTAMIVILVVTSLAMELREYVKYQRFSPGDLVEFSPTHGIASGLFLLITGRRQKLSATPDQSGTVNLCHIMNSALKNASRSSLASSRA
ncbi:hypothetical protein [Pseudomonas avellanae]|uniref:hypothetical protein n=1 Tax=Pseudomonas avellanae TaxID=46257 RepID=UPI0016728822|nr:hypothetical protein [Pseudomonas avellanae]UQW68437.1 hypothetical protein L2Y00_25085 [Pseudomonas avellanae]